MKWLAVVLLVGCYAGGPGVGHGTAPAACDVEVENRNFYDATVRVLRGSYPLARMFVRAQSTSCRDVDIPASGEVRVEVDFIGVRTPWVIEAVYLVEGQTTVVQIGATESMTRVLRRGPDLPLL